MSNFLLSEEITSAFPNLLGNCTWVLGQCRERKMGKPPKIIKQSCFIPEWGRGERHFWYGLAI
jgi:hypothetical protein